MEWRAGGPSRPSNLRRQTHASLSAPLARQAASSVDVLFSYMRLSDPFSFLTFTFRAYHYHYHLKVQLQWRGPSRETHTGLHSSRGPLTLPPSMQTDPGIIAGDHLYPSRKTTPAQPPPRPPTQPLSNTEEHLTMAHRPCGSVDVSERTTALPPHVQHLLPQLDNIGDCLPRLAPCDDRTSPQTHRQMHSIHPPMLQGHPTQTHRGDMVETIPVQRTRAVQTTQVSVSIGTNATAEVACLYRKHSAHTFHPTMPE